MRNEEKNTVQNLKSNGAEDFSVKEIGKYREIFNNSHTPMLVINYEDGQIEDANPAACSYYGYSKAEMLTLGITQINILSDQEISAEMERARTEGRKYFRFRHKLSTGNIKDVEVYSGPIEVDDKILLFSIIHDIEEKREIENNYKIQNSYFVDLFENSPEAIAIVDNEFKIIKINRSFEKIFLYDIDEVRDRNITEVLCDQTAYDESSYIKDGIKRGEFVRKETQRKRKDGKLVPVSILSYPVISNGKEVGIYCIYSDISRVKDEESKHRLFSEVFKNNTVGVVITDVQGTIQWVNNVFTEITGYTSEEAKGRKPSILKSGRHDTEYYSNMWNSILNAGKWQGEIYNLRKNGEVYQEWLNIIAIKNDEGNIENFIAILSDITDARQKEKKIEILTSKDGLTNLYNRDFFINKLNYIILRRNEIQNYDEGLAVLFIDIDEFKEINDSLGHLIGDNILKEFASRLKDCIREYDIAARFGGDEFIVILSSIIGGNEVINVANRILQQVSRPYIIDNHELHLTASIGISCFPGDGKDATTLIRNADIAMYKSKEIKHSKITMFESSLDNEIQEHFKIKNGLRNAISNKELYVHYQPIYDIEKEQIIGAEALLRWSCKEHGPITPTIFIPVAEKTGMIYPIGEWVLREACEQNKEWQSHGYKPIYVSVNVSVMQLEQPCFCKRVEKVLKDTGLEAKYLHLEITETIFTKDYDKIVQVVKSLNRLGVKIAIDDFGTGYSSLGQLSNLDINKLKIDRSFISGVNDSINKSKIVKAIISLSQSLSLELVAEGVETPEQLDFLRESKCNVVQGFWYSKPVDAGMFERLLMKSYQKCL